MWEKYFLTAKYLSFDTVSGHFGSLRDYSEDLLWRGKQILMTCEHAAVSPLRRQQWQV